MTTKKVQPTAAESKAEAGAAAEHKADYTWNSFALTREEARELADEVCDYLTDAPETILLSLLALVNSFTYTRDHSQREYMRSAVKTALLPYLVAAHNAADDGAAAVYLRHVGKGGE